MSEQLVYKYELEDNNGDLHYFSSSSDIVFMSDGLTVGKP